ncbi:MAG: PIN domain-containing protein [Pirellulales bacterium]|nr:PIN domain-containing protein [Pirellulales bacterium]
MAGIVVDTHAFLWYLSEPQRLSATASQAIDHSLDSGGQLFISAITLIEIVYLVEKGRLPFALLT